MNTTEKHDGVEAPEAGGGAQTENPPKKPLAVRLLEIHARAYVVLAALGAVAMMYLAFTEPFFILLGLALAFCIVAFPFRMLRRLRQGRFAWFLVSNLLLMLPFMLEILGVVLLGRLCRTQVWNAIRALSVPLCIAVVPIILALLPSSRKWARAVAPSDCKPRVSSVLSWILGPLLWSASLTYLCCGALSCNLSEIVRGSKSVADAATVMRDIAWLLSDDDIKTGETWIEPSACSNATQFVATVVGKPQRNDKWRSRYFRYARSCCIAVNPPDDDNFPLVISANVDPRELLFPKDAKQPLNMTCPGERGGECLGFCKKFVVVVHKGGAVRSYREGCATPFDIFGQKPIPSPAPDTYYLSPTGRVDLATH